MAGVNKVIIVGNLGNDPELRTFPNGDHVANISVATSEKWQDKQTGEWREVTEWHRIVLFRRLAEIAGQYLKKGSKVYIEGKLKTRKWQDQNGEDRQIKEIQADSLQMLDSKNDSSQQQSNQQQSQQQSSARNAYRDAKNGSYNQQSNQVVNQTNGFDDDIPF